MTVRHPILFEDLLKGHEERIPNISILFVLRPAGETPFHRFRVPPLVSEEIAVAWEGAVRHDTV